VVEKKQHRPQNVEDTANHATLSSAQNTLKLPLEVLSDGSPRRSLIVEANLGVNATKLSTVNQLWFSMSSLWILWGA